MTLAFGCSKTWTNRTCRRIVMKHYSQQSYEFGHFRLNVAERLLLCDRDTVPLTPKAFELLLVLVEQHGHLLEKDELLKLVWPDTFVEETNLTSNISLIRKALGEGENGHKFIETVPKRGYRFVAEVREGGQQNASELPLELNGYKAALEPMAEPKSSLQFSARRITLVAITVLTLAAAAWFFFSRQQPALTDKDFVLVADFVNTTGDPVFDGALKLGLSIRLEQSPYLRVFSEEQVREALRYMSRAPNEPLTKEIAREICLRRGLKAFLIGSIAPLGRHYVLTLEAINAQTGEALAREQIEVSSKEQALTALDQANAGICAKLNTSLSMLPQINAPREHFTTSSLEALRAYHQAGRAGVKGKNVWIDMIPFYKRAIELDPNFAKAWEQLASAYFNSQQQELAEEAIKKAYALRDRESDLERVFTTALYHRIATLDSAKAIEVAEVAKQSYPKNPGIRVELSIYHLDLGQDEEAIKEAREAVRSSPKYSHGYTLLAISLLRTNRFAEAREVLEQGLAQNLNNNHFYQYLYPIAFVQGDTGAMRQQVDRLAGTLYEAESLGAQAQAAAFAGKLRQARKLSDQAITLAEQHNLKDSARRLAMEAATREAVFGSCQQARQYYTRALAVRLGMAYPMTLPIALALCGESAQAQSFSDKLHSQYPNATKFHAVWWPLGRAAIELQHGRQNQVMPLLQFSSNYEQAAYFWPNWLRGQAYLRQQAGKEAAAEFQTILDHRGWDVFSPLYPLAQLGLARAAAIASDPARSRKAYEEFFALWKEADPDLPFMVQAKKEMGVERR